MSSDSIPSKRACKKIPNHSSKSLVNHRSFWWFQHVPIRNGHKGMWTAPFAKCIDVQVREQRVEKCSPGFNQLQRGPLHLSKIACQHSYRCVASTSEIGPKTWPLACQHHGFGWHCAVLGEKNDESLRFILIVIWFLLVSKIKPTCLSSGSHSVKMFRYPALTWFRFTWTSPCLQGLWRLVVFPIHTASRAMTGRQPTITHRIHVWYIC